MLKGAKRKLSEYEDKDVLIMPSTKNLSAAVNNVGFLIMLAIFMVAGYLTGFGFLLWGTWYVGLSIAGGVFIFARLFDRAIKSTKKRQGYIKTDRKTANELINVERAYAKLPKDDQVVYKNYLEGAYYGDATPAKVVEFFDHKLQEAHKLKAEAPKFIDAMIESELPKD